MEWYVVFVETGREEEVQKWFDFYFENETFRSLVPTRRLREKRGGKIYHVLRKLFPGYVFFNINMSLEKYKIIKKIPGIIKILNTGSYYSHISDKEMSIILKLVGDKSVIDYSKVLVENSKIQVKDGPLYGMEGIIKKIDKHKKRAKVELYFDGEPRLVEIGVEIIYTTDKND